MMMLLLTLELIKSFRAFVGFLFKSSSLHALLDRQILGQPKCSKHIKQNQEILQTNFQYNFRLAWRHHRKLCQEFHAALANKCWRCLAEQPTCCMITFGAVKNCTCQFPIDVFFSLRFPSNWLLFYCSDVLRDSPKVLPSTCEWGELLRGERNHQETMMKDIWMLMVIARIHHVSPTGSFSIDFLCCEKMFFRYATFHSHRESSTWNAFTATNSSEIA